MSSLNTVCNSVKIFSFAGLLMLFTFSFLSGCVQQAQKQMPKAAAMENTGPDETLQSARPELPAAISEPGKSDKFMPSQEIKAHDSYQTDTAPIETE